MAKSKNKVIKMSKARRHKVGILTFHYPYNNYGAVLQTYSIYKLIELLGYSPHIINFVPRNPSIKWKILFKLRTVLGFQFDVFRKRYIPNILKETKTEDDLKSLNKQLDCFVVGSDQVWRYRDNHAHLCNYYLDFVQDNKPKVAYAASFGIDCWPGSDSVTQKIQELLKRFHAISVREEAGVDICRAIMGIDGTRVLDPTLVLDRKYFHVLAEGTRNNKTNHNRYLAYMLLDDSPQYQTFFKQLASKHHLDFRQIKGKMLSAKKDLCIFNSTAKWLSYLKYADVVVTDSFHCVVFSIVFRKQFICMSNAKRGVSRLRSMLGLLGLEARFVTSLSQITEVLLTKTIPYDDVEYILDREKQTSLAFLENSLLHS
jgi:hypothetical protein